MRSFVINPIFTRVPFPISDSISILWDICSNTLRQRYSPIPVERLSLCPYPDPGIFYYKCVFVFHINRNGTFRCVFYGIRKYLFDHEL